MALRLPLRNEGALVHLELQNVKLVGFGVETRGQAKCRASLWDPRGLIPSGQKGLWDGVTVAERQGGW